MEVDRRLGLHNVDHDPDGAHLVAPTAVEIRLNFDAIDSTCSSPHRMAISALAL